MNVAAMTTEQRLGAVLQKASLKVPADVGVRLKSLISPASLAIMATVVVLWAGSHFVGVGEIADVALLVAGWAMVGGAALEGSKKLVDFAIGTARASSDADLDRAAISLAQAIGILGVDVALGLLFKGKPAGTFKTVYRSAERIPSFREFTTAMPKAGPTRLYPVKVVFTKTRYAGQGATNVATNVAKVGRDFVPEAKPLVEAVRDVRKTTFHETVHQRFTRAASALGRPALYTKMGAYKRSFILRYVEEMAAETYGLYKVGGKRPGELSGFEFPLNGHYGITLRQMGSELKGVALGPVVVGGATYHAAYGLIDEH